MRPSRTAPRPPRRRCEGIRLSSPALPRQAPARARRRPRLPPDARHRRPYRRRCWCPHRRPQLPPARSRASRNEAGRARPLSRRRSGRSPGGRACVYDRRSRSRWLRSAQERAAFLLQVTGRSRRRACLRHRFPHRPRGPSLRLRWLERSAADPLPAARANVDSRRRRPWRAEWRRPAASGRRAAAAGAGSARRGPRARLPRAGSLRGPC